MIYDDLNQWNGQWSASQIFFRMGGLYANELHNELAWFQGHVKWPGIQLKDYNYFYYDIININVI